MKVTNMADPAVIEWRLFMFVFQTVRR